MLRRLHAYLVRGLRWSEKYTGTDMVYLAHGSFWLSGSSVITGGISFLLALAFANLFTKDAYGTYKYALTLFGLLSAASLRGMDAAVTQGAARGNDGTVTMGLRAKMRWSLLGSLGALAVAAYYFYGHNTVVAVSMLFAAIFVPLMEPFGIFNAVLYGKKDFQLSSLFGIAGQLFSALALALALFLTNNPIVIFVTYCASWTLSRYLSLQITLRKFPPNEREEPHALSFGLHSSFVHVSNILIGSLESILVYHYLGPANLAVYAFAMAPVNHARVILDTPTNLAIPKLAGQTAADIRRAMSRRTAHLFVLGLVATLAYCTLAYPFFRIFLPNYLDAVPFSLVFSVTILLQVTTAFVGAALGSRITLVSKRLLYLWNIPSIIVAVCAVLLIQRFGLWGAITGQVLSCASGGAIAWVLWRTIRYREHV